MVDQKKSVDTEVQNGIPPKGLSITLLKKASADSLC